MTDTERNRVQAICEAAGVQDIDDLSDGFHTFRQLYYQRMILFATIVKQNKSRAWKSLRHEDGELCFGGGWFIVGIDTPEGSYTYHYEDNFYSLFDCEELECAKHWDGHTEKDVTRLLSLPIADATNRKVGKWEVHDILDYTQRPSGRKVLRCPFCGYLTDDFRSVVDYYHNSAHFCPDCGSEMIGSDSSSRTENNSNIL